MTLKETTKSQNLEICPYFCLKSAQICSKMSPQEEFGHPGKGLLRQQPTTVCEVSEFSAWSILYFGDLVQVQSVIELFGK